MKLARSAGVVSLIGLGLGQGSVSELGWWVSLRWKELAE